MTRPPDERTLEAIRKIRAILTEYDLFATMSVVSPTRAHWIYHVDPSWSALSIEDGGRFRIRAKRADFKTREAHQRVVKLTCHAVYQCRDLGITLAAAMQKMIDLLGKEAAFEVEHTPGLDERHDQ